MRFWVIKFGPLIAANLRLRRTAPTGRWYLDQMAVRIGGRRMYVWRAVAHEGEGLFGPASTKRVSTLEIGAG